MNHAIDPELRRRLDELPLVAILRGLQPEDAEDVGAALIDAGFRVLEVPLNRPRGLDALDLLARRFGDDALIGAGTVMRPAEVEAVAQAGGRLIVTPHGKPEVIRAAKRRGLACTPGVATPTEAIVALDEGADALKMFPAETLPPAAVKAWRAVLPASVPLLPVGGITPDGMAPYRAAGAAGFGLGSALYTPGMTADEVGERARRFVAAWREGA